MMAFRPGDTVNVRTAHGRIRDRHVIVTGTGEECGRPVIDYIDNQGNDRWAYAWQAERNGRA